VLVGVAPARTSPEQPPADPAVQCEALSAVLVELTPLPPWDAALPVRSVVQPVPTHCALTSTAVSLTTPAVPETHPFVLLLLQVACAVACAVSVLAVVVLVVLAGHPLPPVLPLFAPAWQLAWAAVDADPVVPVGVSVTDTIADVVIPA